MSTGDRYPVGEPWLPTEPNELRAANDRLRARNHELNLRAQAAEKQCNKLRRVVGAYKSAAAVGLNSLICAHEMMADDDGLLANWITQTQGKFDHAEDCAAKATAPTGGAA